MTDWTESTALIVIDMQKGFDDESFFGPRNNPECEANVAKLLEAWRSHGWPIVYVRHDSQNELSPTHRTSCRRSPPAARGMG